MIKLGKSCWSSKGHCFYPEWLSETGQQEFQQKSFREVREAGLIQRGKEEAKK